MSGTTSPALPAVERVAELIEALFNLEQDLTAQLLCELRRCSTADLEKLFGGSPAAAPAQLEPAKPGPTWAWTH